jgi:hypothetical protein
VRLPFLPPALPAFLGALADFLDGVLAMVIEGGLDLSCEGPHLEFYRASASRLSVPFHSNSILSILIGPE